MNRVDVIVSAEIPLEVTLTKWMEYVEDEVKAGVGSRSPRDPLFSLDRNSVQVTVHSGEALLRRLVAEVNKTLNTIAVARTLNDVKWGATAAVLSQAQMYLRQ
jgi:hypothetical protein